MLPNHENTKLGKHENTSQRCLKGNGVKLEDQNLRVGRKLEFDGATEMFQNDSEANVLLTRKYRAPYVVEAKV